MFLWRRRLFESRFVLWLLVLTVFVGEATITAGWWTAEVGRQPWVVYDVLKTADGVSPVLSAIDVVLSLGMFLVLYSLLLVLFLYLLNRKIQDGPEELEDGRDRPDVEPAGYVPRRLQPKPPRRRPRRRAMTLNDVWFFLFILIIAGYLILDGFDMGVGILLLPLARTDIERRTFLNSIGPVWDGNEVWLVLGGGVLFAVFPLAYASLFSGPVPGVRAGPAGHDPANGRPRVPLEGSGPALAVRLGHRLRRRVGGPRAAARRRLREHRGRSAARRGREHLDRADRPADTVPAARRRGDRRDVRRPGRDLPPDQDGRRAARPDRTGGAAADDRLLPAQHARRGRVGAVPPEHLGAVSRRHLAGHPPGRRAHRPRGRMGVRPERPAVPRLPGLVRDDRAAAHLRRGRALPESHHLDDRPGLQPDDLQRRVGRQHARHHPHLRRRSASRSCCSTRPASTTSSGARPSSTRHGY